MSSLRFRVVVWVQGDELIVDNLDQAGALQLAIAYKQLGKRVDTTAYFPGKR